MEIIPLGDLMRQLVVALGAALVLSGLAVLVRHWLRRSDPERPTPNWTVVVVNIAAGLVIATWGVASLIAAG